MKRVLIFCLLMILCFKLGAEEQNTFRTPDFNFPKEVDSNARAALDKALQVGDHRATVQALVQISLARTVVTRHEVTPVKELIDSVLNLNRLTPDYCALLYLLEAEMVNSLPYHTGGDEKSQRIEEWPTRKQSDLRYKLIDQSIDPLGNGDISSLQNPITHYPGLIDPGDEVGKRCVPTLYDFLMLEYIKCHSGKAEKRALKRLRKLHANDNDHFPLAYLAMYYDAPGRSKRQTRSDYIHQQWGKSEDMGCFFYQHQPSLQTCDDYLRRYPDSPHSANVRDCRANHLRQNINLNYNAFLLPTDSVRIDVNLSRADSCYLAIYKVSTGLFQSDRDFQLRDMQLISQQLVVREKRRKKKDNKRQQVDFAPLPIGYYFVVPTIFTDEGLVCDSIFSPRTTQKKLLHVSELLSFAAMTETSNRVVVVNAANGKPDCEAEVEVKYELKEYDKPGDQYRFWHPNEQGEVFLPLMLRNSNPVRTSILSEKWALGYKLRKGDDVEISYNETLKGYDNANQNLQVSLFTDLGIYRPGEQVKVTAIAYQLTKTEKQVLPETKVNLVLMDVDRKALVMKEVTTDEYGTATHTFQLPEGQKNGSFSILAMINNQKVQRKNFEVSEYKAPTFYIDLSETDRNVKQGKRQVIRGRVMTYTGLPVANAEIYGEITPEGWVRYKKFEDEDFEFEAVTDEEGRFEYKCPRVLTRSRKCRYFNYHVEVECEDAANETQEASMWFRVGTDTQLNIDRTKDSYLIEEGQPLTLPISLQATDPNVTEARCRYELQARKDKKYKRVKKGTFSSNNPQFDWSDVPSGEYRLIAKPIGLKHSSELAQTIKLFRRNETQAPFETAVWAPDDLQQVDEQGVAHLSVYSSFDTPVYYLATDQSSDVASGWIDCHPGLNQLDIQIPVKPNNHLNVTFLACRNKKITQEEVHLVSPVKEVTLRAVSFRDKLSANAHEQWSFRLEDADGNPLQASMMLELYSKALEDLNTNQWRFSPNYLPTRSTRWDGTSRNYRSGYSFNYRKEFPFTKYQAITPQFELYGMNYQQRPGAPKSSEPKQPKVQKEVNGVVLDETGEPVIGASVLQEDTDNGTVTDIDGEFSLDMVKGSNRLTIAYVGYQTTTVYAEAQMTVRLQEDENLLEDVVVVGYGAQKKSLMTGSIATPIFEEQEEIQLERLDNITARMGNVKVPLWQPLLRTDSTGTFTLDFDVVNEGGTWCLQALAYTKGLATDIFRTEVLTQRPLMVNTALPRFLRIGDKSQLKARVQNASDTLQQVKALIELFDPRTQQILSRQTYDLVIAPKATEVVAIDYQAQYDATYIGFRVKALTAQGDGDGEQQMIPILAFTAPVVESQPFFLTSDQQQFTIDVPEARTDSTSRFTLEYSDNPAWYCMEALPKMVNEDLLTSNGLSHSLFALAVSDKVRRHCPQQLLAADTLQYGVLMDSARHEQQWNKVVKQLQSMQYPDGSISWLPITDHAMTGSYWGTGTFVEIMGDLLTLNCLPDDDTLHEMLKRGLNYMDNYIIEQAQKDTLAARRMRFLPYAYTRLMFDDMDYEYKDDQQEHLCDSIIQLTTEAVRQDWRNLPLDDRAFAAMLLSRNGHRAEALRILESFDQLAIHHPKLGMYWENMNRQSWFHPVACTARNLQAFCEVGAIEYASSIEQIKQWLLLEKQTSDWGNSSMAAHAIHSLLLSGDEWLAEACDTEIRIDGNSVTDSISDYAKGLMKISVPTTAQQIQIIRQGRHPAWGALYHEYVAPVTEIVGDSLDEISIRKEFWIKDGANQWHEAPVDSLGRPLFELGQHVQVRLIIKCGKALEKLVLHDDRAAFLEPFEQISGYHYDNEYYYQEVKDSRMNFYFDRLSEDVHVVSFDCSVTHSGTYACGIAEIRSAYAPQYVAHSPGFSVVVTPAP